MTAVVCFRQCARPEFCKLKEGVSGRGHRSPWHEIWPHLFATEARKHPQFMPSARHGHIQAPLTAITFSGPKFIDTVPAMSYP